uniref:Putative secreted protein n=1 Tax=Ixodes ricinus TaxID=34613 RepID=A0A131Y503_IXORI
MAVPELRCQDVDDTAEGDLGLSDEYDRRRCCPPSASMEDLSRTLIVSPVLSAASSFDSLLGANGHQSWTPSPEFSCQDRTSYPDEITFLQSELDICKRLLNAKYLAAHILLKQLLKVSEEKEQGNKINHLKFRDLFKELNTLQYELQCMEEHLRISQQSWLDKLNSIMEENLENKAKLKAQSETIKKLTYTAQVLRRERDELLALTDVKERDVYLQSCMDKFDEWCDSSSLEVAVLAACMCRGPNQEPCKCAHAVSYKQRQLNELTERAKKLEAQMFDNAKTSDIYREAFEVQLAKNRKLTRKVIELQSRKDVLGTIIAKSKGIDNQKSLIDDLVENLCDKNEALVHQQVMVKLLALQIGRMETSQMDS